MKDHIKFAGALLIISATLCIMAIMVTLTIKFLCSLFL
jgi:hypothetical protein